MNILNPSSHKSIIMHSNPHITLITFIYKNIKAIKSKTHLLHLTTIATVPCSCHVKQNHIQIYRKASAYWINNKNNY